MARGNRAVLTVCVFLALLSIGVGLTTVTIDIEKKAVNVIEHQAFAEVCLVKSGPSSHPIMALVNAEELTGNVGSPLGSIEATSEEDFGPDVPAFVLSSNETRKCVMVTIIDDQIVEQSESFEVIISFPPDQPALQSSDIVPPGMQITGVIRIIDDDAITVQFEQDMYVVRESDGMVDVRVVASGRTSFAYTFTVTPMDLTATNSFDYIFSTTKYEFAPSNANEPIPSLVISIPFTDDEINNEFNKNFKLTVKVSAKGKAANVTEGAISKTVVLIKDDDVTTAIQLYLRPVSDCPTWVETKNDVKLTEISAAVSVPLQLLCNCSLSVHRRFFSCLGTTESQTVVFLAELSYTALPGVDMPSLLTSWIVSTPHIIVASAQLQVDTTCPVVIDSLEPESCTVASPTELPTSIIVAAVAACVSVLLVVVIIVVLVISVVVCCKRRSKHRDVDMTDMTENPSCVTAKEVVTSFSYGTEEEEEGDHRYEVLPFEVNEKTQRDAKHDKQEEATENVPMYANLQ